MSEKKTLLIGFGVVAALCLCAVVVAVLGFGVFGVQMAKSIKMDPTDIAGVGNRIATFDVPSGYTEAYAMSILNYDTVGLVPDNSSSTDMIFMLMQFNGSLTTDPAQMEDQVQRAMQQQFQRSGGPMSVVEQRQETIRGKSVTVTISESAGATQSVKMRQWMAVFQGNHGPTILMIQGSSAHWDNQLIEDFIKSIR